MIFLPADLRDKIDRSSCHLGEFKWIIVELITDKNGLNIKNGKEALKLLDEYINIRNNPNQDIMPQLIKVEALCDCLNDISDVDFTFSQIHKDIILRDYTDTANSLYLMVKEWANGDHDRLVYVIDFLLRLMQEDDDYYKVLCKAFPKADKNKFYQSAEILAK